ncbi:glutaredoxin family protein [Halomonas sp.]|uniref:glutaredoxin family protein n=1 Tax=Halomonas sp. TaxID=1486246 RepID=UPI003563F8A4
MIQLRFYTTLGCHLCEQLQALLLTLAADEVWLEKIEISEDDALVERYGMRIPVLEDERGEVLDRGFDAPRLAAWLSERGRLDEAAWEALQRQLAGEVEPREMTRAVMRGGRRYLG